MWKDIENGALSVSDDGKIRSNLRDGRILKAQIDNKGYSRVRVTINRQKKTFKVHRLVAEAFIPNPKHLPQVNHIDGNKQNNSISNLEWVSNQENAMHAIKTGLWDSVINGAKRENESRMKPISATNGNTTLFFKSVSEAERYFNSRHVVDVLKGKRQHVKGFTFQYEEGGDAT